MNPLSIAGLTLACLVGCTPLAAQTTNAFFVTAESDAPYKEEPATAEQVARAKLSKDSRPALDDPEGHWGRVKEGFQVSIRFDSEVFTNGQPVVATILLRNVSTNKLWFPLSYGADRQTSFVLKRDQELVARNGEGKAGIGLETRLRAVHAGSEGLCPNLVGTQRRFLVDLCSLYKLTPGKCCFGNCV